MNCKFLPTEENYFNEDCVVCKNIDPKYKCPNCDSKYCGVECNNTHKNSCKTKLFHSKKISQMNVNDLKNDLNFLSNVLDKTNKVKKILDILEKNCKMHSDLQRFRILRTNSKKRGIELKFIPNIFNKHRINVSFYFTKEKIIYWNLDLHFIFSQNLKINITLDPINEYEIVQNIINKESIREKILNDNILIEQFKTFENYLNKKKYLYIKNNIIKDRILNYNFSNLDIADESIEYIKENMEKKYIKIPLKSNLQDILLCQNIVEFPKIIIFFNESDIDFN